jgi:hypothetical protein
LNVVIVYDHQTAYRRAIRLLASTLVGHEPAVEIRPRPWRCEELQASAAAQLALSVAADADVFLVSTAARAELSAGVLGWLEEAFRRRDGRLTAVMALFDHDDDPHSCGENSARRVRDVAGAAGLHFLEPASLAEPAIC